MELATNKKGGNLKTRGGGKRDTESVGDFLFRRGSLSTLMFMTLGDFHAVDPRFMDDFQRIFLTISYFISIIYFVGSGEGWGWKPEFALDCQV